MATIPSRVAVRDRLCAAGILTATGEVSGAEGNRPDAAIFALIEMRKVAWAAYSDLWKRRRTSATDKAARRKWYDIADDAKLKLAETHAVTRQGAVAKAAFVLADCFSGPIDAFVASALRDAQRGATASAELSGSVVAIGDRRLLALLNEMEALREIARPDEPSGYGPQPERDTACRRFIAIVDAVSAMPATTADGIAAKLESAMPRGRGWSADLQRSAIVDLLNWDSVGEPWGRASGDPFPPRPRLKRRTATSLSAKEF